MNTLTRCAWCTDDPLYQAYHDQEWGIPVHDDRTLFEFLTLEGAQAGLSWLTILRKRENYRRAFENHDISRIASYGDQEIQRLLNDAGIVRNRLKIAATIGNARATLAVQARHGSLNEYLWGFVDGQPIINHWRHSQEVPASTALSDTMSKELKRLGFRFVGTTICHAFMQAVGMVNDHTVDCFRYGKRD